jgi:hypothetical protein
MFLLDPTVGLAAAVAFNRGWQGLGTRREALGALGGAKMFGISAPPLASVEIASGAVASRLVSTQAPPAAPHEPQWLGEALRRVAPYLRTLVGFSFAPARSARRWRVDEGTAMNPVAFMATSAILMDSAQRVLDDVFHNDVKRSFAAELHHALGPYLYYAGMGLLCHAALRLFRVRGPWTNSVGIALLCGAGIPSVATLLCRGSLVLFKYAFGLTGRLEDLDLDRLPGPARLAFLSLAMLSYGWFLVVVGRAFVGLWKLPAWAGALLSVFVFVSGAAVGALFPLPVLHATIALVRTQDGASVTLGIRDPN